MATPSKDRSRPEGPSRYEDPHEDRSPHERLSPAERDPLAPVADVLEQAMPADPGDPQADPFAGPDGPNVEALGEDSPAAEYAATVQRVLADRGLAGGGPEADEFDMVEQARPVRLDDDEQR